MLSLSICVVCEHSHSWNISFNPNGRNTYALFHILWAALANVRHVMLAGRPYYLTRGNVFSSAIVIQLACFHICVSISIQSSVIYSASRRHMDCVCVCVSELSVIYRMHGESHRNSWEFHPQNVLCLSILSSPIHRTIRLASTHTYTYTCTWMIYVFSFAKQTMCSFCVAKNRERAFRVHSPVAIVIILVRSYPIAPTSLLYNQCVLYKLQKNSMHHCMCVSWPVVGNIVKINRILL